MIGIWVRLSYVEVLLRLDLERRMRRFRKGAYAKPYVQPRLRELQLGKVLSYLDLKDWYGGGNLK